MIIFSNPGEIDLEAALTLGVHAKETDSPIGKFGTGLKYAIAVCLRHGCEITIWQGLKKHEFGAVAKITRGIEYQQVTCNGQPLGFTTTLGKHWQLWQAYRELYSNALDENGGARSTNTVNALPKTTSIVVTGAAFEDIHLNRGKFLLIDRKPLEEGPQIVLYSGQGIYYKGILVKDASTAYAYNFKDGIRLTEDRTIENTWDVEFAITYHLCNFMQKRLKRVLSDGPFAEQAFVFPSNVSEDAKHLLVDLANKDLVPQRMKSYVDGLRKVAGNYPTRTPTPRETAMLADAIEVLTGIGLAIESDVIFISDKLPPNTMGCATQERIYLSGSVFVSGQVPLIGTLLEEHCHYAMGYQDMSRRFQSYLIDMIATLAIEKKSS